MEKEKGQGALEYLLLIAGAVLIAAVVIIIALNMTGAGNEMGQEQLTEHEIQTAKQFMIKDDLVAHWNFDGILTDSQGSSDGTINGTEAYDDDGRRDQAISFDGSSYVDVGDMFASDQPELSAGGWIYANSFNTGASNIGTGFIGDWDYDVTGQTGWSLRVFYNAGGDTLRWNFVACDGDADGLYINIAYDDQPKDDFTAKYAGKWLHVVGTFSAPSINNRARLYIDGEMVAETSATNVDTITPGTDNTVLIGRSTVNGGDLVGLIDEVTVYDRELTEKEVLNLYYYGQG